MTCTTPNIANDDGLAYRQIMDYQLGQPAPAARFARCPIAYVWDDHDWGGADGDAGSRPAAMAVYRQAVPHYPLQASSSPIYQASTIGRVRILTDARSDREPADDGLPGTMLGAAQKEWFGAQLEAAATDDAAVVWVNPVPWVSEPVSGGDGWAGFPEERTEVADMIAAAGLADRLVMLGGDAHMVALDDGTNTDYSTAQVGGFPLLHAAALDRPGSVEGGPYSHGSFPGGGQFGHLVVDDEGVSVTITMTGRNWRNEILVEHRCTI